MKNMLKSIQSFSITMLVFAGTLIVLLSNCTNTREQQNSFIATEKDKTTSKMINRHGELVVPPFLLEEYKQNTNNATTIK